MSFSAPANEVRLLERLLPIACAGSALILLASEFMNTFVISEPVQGGLCEIAASDRHLYGLAVLAGFAVVAMLVALRYGSKPAASAVAACGVVALVLFLALDVPDATATGTLGEGCSPVEGSFAEVSAVPQSGFWLALLGALGLAATGLALATFRPEQLTALAPKWLRAGDPAERAQRSGGSREPLSGPRGRRGARGTNRPARGAEAVGSPGPDDADEPDREDADRTRRERARRARRRPSHGES